MKKTLITLAIIIGVLALAVGIFYLDDYLKQPTEEEIEDARKQIEKEFTTPESDMPEETRIDLIELFPNDMPEYRMQTVIHSLSHQKVASDKNEKWGQLQITQERVERILKVAELNRELYEYGEQYITILERWAIGDFSRAVENHNFIWDIQSGNVGKATRLLNPVEEKAYIEQYFKNNEDDIQE